MRKKTNTRPVENLSVAAKLARRAHSIDEHTTEAEMHSAVIEAIETIVSCNTDSMARETTLFALLRFLHDYDDAGHSLLGRAASVAFSYTDLGTEAEIATWLMWQRNPERR
jgi:hypothetical protein